MSEEVVKFKVGDKVKCKDTGDSKYLVVGIEYTVMCVSSEGYIHIKEFHDELPNHNYPSRWFKLVEEKHPLEFLFNKVFDLPEDKATLVAILEKLKSLGVVWLDGSDITETGLYRSQRVIHPGLMMTWRQSIPVNISYQEIVDTLGIEVVSPEEVTEEHSKRVSKSITDTFTVPASIFTEGASPIKDKEEKQMKKEDLYEAYIWIGGVEETSRRVQEKLFELGISWYGNFKYARYTDKEVLIITESGELLWSNAETLGGSNYATKEVFLHEILVDEGFTYKDRSGNLVVCSPENKTLWWNTYPYTDSINIPEGVKIAIDNDSSICSNNLNETATNTLKPQEEKPMTQQKTPATIDHVVQINGRNSDDYTDSDLLSMIREHEETVKHLESLTADSQYVSTKVKKIKTSILSLVGELDSRIEDTTEE